MENNSDNTNLQRYADVILPLAVPLLYTYAIPHELASQVQVGTRVLVQLGTRKIYTAIVYSIHLNKPQHYQVKCIDSVLDSIPIVTPIQLQLWDWIAKYYMCTRGEVMKAALPAGLKLESEALLYCNPIFDSIDTLSNNELIVYSAVQNAQGISLDELTKIVKKIPVTRTVHGMLQNKVLLTGEKVIQQYKPKTETRIQLAGSISDETFVNTSFEMVAKAPKQLELFTKFLDLHIKSKNPDFSILKKELLLVTGCSASIVAELTKKNILVECNTNVSRLHNTHVELQEFKILSESQQKALQQINTAFKTHDTCLLHGVTASGKTEVYIELIKQTIAQNKQVLYLLPEIALTSQIIDRLQKVFGNIVGVYHSRFSDNERIEVWNNVLSLSTYKIILGVRSSIFLPYSNLGLIIVDEEHETSLKQFDPAPRYNARDTAIILAQLHKAKTLLGTATPSLETYYNVLQKKYALVELNQRFSQVQLPQIHIIDMAKARKQKRMYNAIFSKDLLNQIELALQEKQQVILFQNRRGFTPLIQCTDCGNIPHCKHCDVSLTYHKYSNTLRCHYCGYAIQYSPNCIACGSNRQEYLGFGTEQIQDTLQEIFPHKHIARMDLDTTRGKYAYHELIEQFEHREIDILIGTQMITKGLDFENVGLVGIISADSILHIPDFRSFERGFQMMVQVAGRAGRSSKQGRVFIQTYIPEHPILQYVKQHNYHGCMHSQMIDRQTFNYPPFVRLIRLTIKHKNHEICKDAATQFAHIMHSNFGSIVLGPESPIIPRLHNYYIQEILFKIPRSYSVDAIKDTIYSKAQIIFANQNYKGIQWYANVDPY
ncbi:MAG TPA: primosomal protein N' [Bacteroidales bacterium]|nr:primosomal protein N' [Bacteroidales bacterium]